MRGITFLLELMQGCQMNCQGCMVDKFSTNIPSDKELDQLIGMFEGLRSDGVQLLEIELGPSDIFSAQNKEEIFTNPKLVHLINLFDSISVNASFIYPHKDKYDWLIESVSQFKGFARFAPIIPIEVEHALNEKYMARISENLRYLYTNYRHPVFRTALNVIFSDKYDVNSVGRKRNYPVLFQAINGLQKDPLFMSFNTRVDFVFHHGRASMMDEGNKRAFKHSWLELYKQYALDHHYNKGDTIDGIPRYLHYDTENSELIYHNGNLYVRPILNDRVNFIDQRFKFLGPWTSAGLQAEFTNRYINNTALAIERQDCSECSFISECAKRFTHDVMDVVDFDKCMTGLNHYEKL